MPLDQSVFGPYYGRPAEQDALRPVEAGSIPISVTPDSAEPAVWVSAGDSRRLRLLIVGRSKRGKRRRPTPRSDSP